MRLFCVVSVLWAVCALPALTPLESPSSDKLLVNSTASARSSIESTVASDLSPNPDFHSPLTPVPVLPPTIEQSHTTTSASSRPLESHITTTHKAEFVETSRNAVSDHVVIATKDDSVLNAAKGGGAVTVQASQPMDVPATSSSTPLPDTNGDSGVNSKTLTIAGIGVGTLVFILIY